jgi:hypothetical protein
MNSVLLLTETFSHNFHFSNGKFLVIDNLTACLHSWANRRVFYLYTTWLQACFRMYVTLKFMVGSIGIVPRFSLNGACYDGPFMCAWKKNYMFAEFWREAVCCKRRKKEGNRIMSTGLHQLYENVGSCSIFLPQKGDVKQVLCWGRTDISQKCSRYGDVASEFCARVCKSNIHPRTGYEGQEGVERGIICVRSLSFTRICPTPLSYIRLYCFFNFGAR